MLAFKVEPLIRSNAAQLLERERGPREMTAGCRHKHLDQACFCMEKAPHIRTAVGEKIRCTLERGHELSTYRWRSLKYEYLPLQNKT